MPEVWELTFVNAHGQTFRALESELTRSEHPIWPTTILEYIEYCLDRKSILVGMKKVPSI